MEMTENKTLRRCLQTKCTFNIENPNIPEFFAVGCPMCVKCQATANVVNQECSTCLSCEGDEGVMRNSGNKHAQLSEIIIENRIGE